MSAAAETWLRVAPPANTYTPLLPGEVLEIYDGILEVIEA